MLINDGAVRFSHVRQKCNQVADILANLGVGICQLVNAKDWDMIPDLTTRAWCKDLIQTKGTCV